MVQPPVPQKAAYWAMMSEWAGYIHTQLSGFTHPADDGLGLAQVYYDGELCRYRLADHFLDTATYYPMANECSKWYLDYYVQTIAPPGSVQGYRAFVEGLAERYLRIGDANALSGINNILANCPWVIFTDSSSTTYSRECAYGIETFIHAARAGVVLTGAQVSWRNQLLEWALGHIQQWCVSMTAPYFRPFMGGLTAHALIDYYTFVNQDPRIKSSLTTLANYMVSTCWDETGQAFNYSDRAVPPPDNDADDLNPVPDLNMLIAPLFGWLWWQTGSEGWRTQGNKIFQGGIPVYNGAFHVSGTSLNTRSPVNPLGKQYDQQLIWGPMYILWAESDPVGSEVVIPPPYYPPPSDPPPGGGTAGAIKNVVYKTYSKLSCGCDGSFVIVCVDPSLTYNAAPYVEGQVTYQGCALDACGVKQYSYYISYNDTQMADADLATIDIQGVICRGCLTKYIDYKAPFVQPVGGVGYTVMLPEGIPAAGQTLEVLSISGTLIVLGWTS